ncbi:RelA/SpoT [Penicillium cinerascens]|uniref:RelA/SpoT n=1 Tax=Penicillium cinerascens TaxID=70096 RepID=A0A9W9J609_9EURO|nr:RelA/SpoT [Penicillium cinerascens]KAJ5190517.1 RelA/SpoT [Penicillium cinerascens]
MAIQIPIKESLIPMFIHQYKKKEFQDLAESVEYTCNQALLEKGIPHVTQSRGKDPESLRKKLEQRERENGPYETLEQIHEDIVDLAGARIILERWEDRHFVQGIIHEIFEVKEEKYKKEKRGYEAVHCRVYLKQGGNPCGPHTTRARQLVEIQVLFLYMAQWAKDEHDRYKSIRDPSRALSNSLDACLQVLHLHETLARHTREEKTRQNAKYKQKFTSTHVVGSHLEKWILRYAADWVKSGEKTIGSATALTKFLNACEWTTPESLDRLLREHLGKGAQDEYSGIAKEYNGIDLNLIIYLIDRAVLKHSVNSARPFQDPNSHEEHVYKIQVILSTFIWMNRLFQPTLEWQRLFTRVEDQKTIRQGILWLGNSARQNFIGDGSFLTEDEIGKLNGLWDWFSRNLDRPVMLAFTMSNQGVVRDIPREKDELEDALGPLSWALSRA